MKISFEKFRKRWRGVCWRISLRNAVKHTFLLVSWKESNKDRKKERIEGEKEEKIRKLMRIRTREGEKNEEGKKRKEE